MQNFEWETPTKIIFGKDILNRLGEESAKLGKRALLVYGEGSIKRNGLYDTIVGQLSSSGISWHDHPGIKPNPTLNQAEEGIRKARDFQADLIIAAGGASVIDAAKAIAFGSCHDGALWDFYLKKREIKKALPLIAIQTLPATSSEMNPASVLTHQDTGEKFSARSIRLFPKVSFLDPDLTLNIPLQYTAYACTDILSHMMEGYLTAGPEWNPVQDGMTEGICRAVIEAMERLLLNPKDREARSAVLWAGALAWNGILKAGVEGASIPNHMLEHPLSGLYGITHGAGLSIIIPAWLKYKKEEILPRLLCFGERILQIQTTGSGLTASQRGDLIISSLEAWYRKIGTPVSCREAGISTLDIPALTKQALELCRHWNIPGYTQEDLERIYRLCR